MSTQKRIPFNKPYMVGNELEYIFQAYQSGHLSGNGAFTKQCHKWLKKHQASKSVLLTHSGTSALEMMALLLDIKPGDEIIMPSFTFVSTANAFVLRGAMPVFVDIRADTMNMDEKLVEQAITAKTKAIMVVHYAGVACEMDTIRQIASQHGLPVLEDAAQGLMSYYKGAALGSLGALGALSFHETKNIISGEGGCIIINEPRFEERAEIIWEKGTDRGKMARGEVDKYTWRDLGSSYLPSDILAAFLYAQLEHAENITKIRLHHWHFYHEHLAALEQRGCLRRPFIPETCRHNGHIYYILLRTPDQRTQFIRFLQAKGITATFHYIPLHSSPAGLRFARASSSMDITDDVSARLVRLPLWNGMNEHTLNYVLEAINAFCNNYINS